MTQTRRANSATIPTASLTYTYTLEGYAGQASLEEGIPSPHKDVPNT